MQLETTYKETKHKCICCKRKFYLNDFYEIRKVFEFKIFIKLSDLICKNCVKKINKIKKNVKTLENKN